MYTNTEEMMEYTTLTPLEMSDMLTGYIFDGIYKLTTLLEEVTRFNVRRESQQNNYTVDAKTSQTHNRHPRKCCTNTTAVTWYTTGQLVIIIWVYTRLIH